MGSSRMSLKRSLLVSTFAALSLFSTATLAQGNTKPTPTTSTTSPNAKTTSTTAAVTTSPTGKDQKSTSSTSDKTSSTKLPPLSSSTTSSTSTGPPPKLTGMPTASKTVDTSVPTYPPPSPPPVHNAPFMNRSTLPDGTVFIAVGAILGAFGLAILLWRGIIAYLLKRSVEKAAMAQHTTNDKLPASFPAPPETFYKYTDDSSLSLTTNLLSGSGRGQRRTNRGPIPSQTPSTTNLFFSPTAAGASGGSSTNRHSSFLPSGFYAATSAAPAAQGHGHGQSVSLSNLNPASNRGSHVPVRQTPPESPEFGPQRSTPPHHSRHPSRNNNFSTSSISLNRPPSGRAPSAYLEDLLDEQPNAFPPAVPPQQASGHYRGHSGGQQGRF